MLDFLIKTIHTQTDPPPPPIIHRHTHRNRHRHTNTHTTTTHHRELVDHCRDPTDVHTFINHSYKQSVRVRVDPVLGCALWVTHPDAGSIPDVNAELSQRTTVQPEGGSLIFKCKLLSPYTYHTQWGVSVMTSVTRTCGTTVKLKCKNGIISIRLEFLT